MLVGACEEPRTQIVVRVTSDLVIDEELDAFLLTIRGPDGDEERSQTVDLGPRRNQLPVTFGVAPRGGDPDREVRVELTAFRDYDPALDPFDPSPNPPRVLLFETHRVVTFRKWKKLLLDVVLSTDCVDRAVPCREDEACAPGGCIPEQVDPETLPEWEPDEEAP